MSTINIVDQIIGSRMRERRLSQNIALQKMAADLNIDSDQLDDFENGLSRMSAHTLLNAGGILGVNTKFFFEPWVTEELQPTEEIRAA